MFHEKWGSPAHNVTSCTHGFPWDNPIILWYEAFKCHDLITVVSAASRRFSSATVFRPSPRSPTVSEKARLDWCSSAGLVAFAPSLQTSTSEKTNDVLGVLTSQNPWKCLKGLPAGSSQAALGELLRKVTVQRMGFEVWATWQRVSAFICRMIPTHLRFVMKGQSNVCKMWHSESIGLSLRL